MLFWKDTCTPVLIAALFALAKIRRQPACLSVDEYDREDVVCVDYYSAIKKSEILPFATTWVDLEGMMLSEENCTERQILYITYMCNIKNITN